MATRVSVQNRVRASAHEGFLTLGRSRWAKIAGTGSLIVLLVYVFHDPQPRPNGGTWYGYTLGTIGALLILWLTALGIRKRAMTRGRWSLKSWTSAHVWLGLSLIVIGTLHTGFQFGWNVHTLAYALMMLVIVSGLFGVFAYAILPRVLSDNRNETTEPQMLEQLRSVDRQLHEAAQPLAQHHDNARLADAARRHHGAVLVEQRDLTELAELQDVVFENLILLPPVEAGVLEVGGECLQQLGVGDDVAADLFGGADGDILVAVDDRLAGAALQGEDRHEAVGEQRYDSGDAEEQRETRGDVPDPHVSSGSPAGVRPTAVSTDEACP